MSSLRASVIVLLSTALLQGDVRLLINGKAYSPQEGEIELAPGASNRVVVEAANLLGIVLTRTLPDGRAYRQRASVNATHPRAEFALGPMSAPPYYEYEAGVVRQRGYRISVVVIGKDGRRVAAWEFQQALSKVLTTGQHGMGEGILPVKPLRLAAGAGEWPVYNPAYGGSAPFSLRLNPAVLLSQDDVRVEVRRNGQITLPAAVRVLDEKGKELWKAAVTWLDAGRWQIIPVSAASWPEGEYRVVLEPWLNGEAWPDGPSVIYRRAPVKSERVLVSPLANWTLDRDAARQEITVTDFREAHRKWGAGKVDERHWEWSGAAPVVSLANRGHYTGDPVVFRFPARGHYAVFLGVADSGVYVQVGRNGLIRPAPVTQLGTETFVAAADLTDDEIRLYPSGDPARYLDAAKWKEPRGRAVRLRLVPVTAESVKRFYQEMAEPPLAMFSVNDWAEFFSPPWARLEPDQYDTVVCGEAEIGFRGVEWSVGRSWVEYHSRLPRAQLFPTVPYQEAQKVFDYSGHDYGRRIHMIAGFDPLEGATRARGRCGAKVWSWLGMQRHYGANAYGGIFASSFFKNNRQWWRIGKDGGDTRGLSFFFPEVRQERLDILLETAGRGVDGLLVGCDRQVPMLLYNPAMVEAYQRKTGVDPRTLDAANGTAYRDWIRWRADFFTQVLRDLRAGLKGQKLPVAVRLPSAGLFLNLAQGVDVEQWLKEGLVDQLQLDPLEDLKGRAEHDVRPYLALGHRYGVPVIGGMGASTYIGAGGTIAWDYSRHAIGRAGPDLTALTAGVKRALGLMRAGVDGIDAYEVELLAQVDPIRFLVAMYGHPRRLERFLEESNLEAVAPIDANNAAAGHDNHSRWDTGWSVEGRGRNAL